MDIKYGPYRAKPLGSTEWVYGFYMEVPPPPQPWGPVEEPKCYIILEDPHYLPDWNLPWKMVQREVDRKTVCRFAGRTDVNGTPIYERDYILGNGYGPYPVFWDDDFTGFCSRCYSDAEPIGKYKTIQVVGNEIDDPDMLKEEEED